MRVFLQKPAKARGNLRKRANMAGDGGMIAGLTKRLRFGGIAA